MQLFVARAQASDPRFALHAENQDAIAEICRRLDGLPLAIELAAARVHMFSPGELRARFDHALPYLSDGPTDAPTRLRTMRQAIAWSYDLLTPAEQALFRRLAVFVGSFTLEAAEAVSRGVEASSSRDSPSPITLVRLRRLVHLARPQPPAPGRELCRGDSPLHRRGARGEPRFALLETVREFGLEALAASGEEPEVRDAHAAYFMALAERAEPELQGATWEVWVDRLISELPNLRAALDELREQGDGERAMRLAAALGLFWTMPSYIREGRAWLEMAVDLPGVDRAPESLAKALNAIGVVAQ